MIEQSHPYGLIEIINSVNHNILFIDDRYYVIDVFEPADSHRHKHEIRGRDFTYMVPTYLSLQKENANKETISEILSKILTSGIVKREYHRDYKFIVFYS